VDFDQSFAHLSDKNVSREPWRSLPAEIADVIEPELEATTDEILATIAREVPDYARPLEGSFGRGVRTGVSEALRQFVELIRSPSGARGPGREVYVGLGSGELSQGRTLDALQSAYRVGARVAWRRLAAAATRAGVEPDVLSLLAESIFAYIETLSADSVEGYAEARARLEGERRRRRHELVAVLVREPTANEADLRAAAEAVGWRVPRTAAALACDEEQLDRLATRLPADALAAGLDGVGCAIVPDPDGPGRPSQIERAVGSAGIGAVLGPTGAPGSLAGSWSLARATLRAVGAGAIETPGGTRNRSAGYAVKKYLFPGGPPPPLHVQGSRMSNPIGPAPRIATLSPTRMLARSTACNAMPSGSSSAASSKSHASGTGKHELAGTTSSSRSA